MSTGGFSETLAYVYIPSLHITGNEGAEKQEKSYGAKRGPAGQVLENPKMGRNDLVKVFDKLSSCGVKRILRLQVDDLEHPSHTDSAIEMALQGRESFPSQEREPFPSHNRTPSVRDPSYPAILVETW